MKGFLLFALVVLLPGCSLITPPMERPVIEEKLNRGFIDDSSAVGTLSLTPERRVVLVKFSEKKKDGTGSPSRFCAEAPTEVGLDVSRLTKATASLKKPEQIEAGLEAIAAATIGNSVLNKRTQGVQLFQSSSYFLCQMYMNDAINAEQLMRLQLEALRVAENLVSMEIPLLYEKNAEVTKSTFKHLDVNPLMDELLKLKTPEAKKPAGDAAGGGKDKPKEEGEKK